MSNQSINIPFLYGYFELQASLDLLLCNSLGCFISQNSIMGLHASKYKFDKPSLKPV